MSGATRQTSRNVRGSGAGAEHLVAEILAGELYTTPRPAPRHAVANSGLGVDLGSPFDRGRGRPGGWWVLDEPELHVGEDVFVPDLAGWRRTRLPTIPDAAFFTVLPNWGTVAHTDPVQYSTSKSVTP